MKMFVANASFQKFDFSYRLKGQELSKTRTMPIQEMSQVTLPDDLEESDVNYIIAQHEPYGFVDVRDVRDDKKTKQRTVLMFSTDGPIPAAMIQHLHDLNHGVMTEFGRRLREEAAVVSNTALTNALEMQRRQGLDADLGRTEMTVQQVEPEGGYKDNPIGEGYEVVDESKPRSGRRNR